MPGYYNLAIVQTFIDFDNNSNLKPSKSLRTELGMDYRLPFGSINITGFYNKLYDGITNESTPLLRQVANLDIAFNGTELPTYDVSGFSPFYYTQNKLVNKYNSIDKGVEFFMSFEKTPLPNVTFDIQGSYTETLNRDDVEQLVRSNNLNTPEKFGIVAPFEVNYKQFRLGANINYHLPKIGLVIAVRSEHFLIQETNYSNQRHLYGYLDADLNKTIIPDADRNNLALYQHIMPSLSYLDSENRKIYNNFHLRVSKDFLNGFRFSFYANNFLDINHTELGLENGRYIKRTKPDMVQLSFGSKIQYQF